MNTFGIPLFTFGATKSESPEPTDEHNQINKIESGIEIDIDYDIDYPIKFESSSQI